MGLRRETINELEQITGTEEHSLYKANISAQTCHEIYRMVFDEEPVMMNGKTWHLKKVCEELEIDVRKSWHVDSFKMPLNEMQELAERLKQYS